MNAYFLFSLHLDDTGSMTFHPITTGAFVFIRFANQLCFQPRKLSATCRVSVYSFSNCVYSLIAHKITRCDANRLARPVTKLFCAFYGLQVIQLAAWRTWMAAPVASEMPLNMELLTARSSSRTAGATSTSSEQADRTSCTKCEMELGRNDGCCWCRCKSVDF